MTALLPLLLLINFLIDRCGGFHTFVSNTRLQRRTSTCFRRLHHGHGGLSSSSSSRSSLQQQEQSTRRSSRRRRIHEQQRHQERNTNGMLVCLDMAATYDDELFVKAQDGEALQTLFSKQCDKDGLMTKDVLEKKVPVIADLLDGGDLLQEELNDIWDAAPKFPEVDEKELENGIERIDVDSFIQIYRDIDDLFEDEEEDDEDEKNNDESSSNTSSSSVTKNTNNENVVENNNKPSEVTTAAAAATKVNAEEAESKNPSTSIDEPSSQQSMDAEEDNNDNMSIDTTNGGDAILDEDDKLLSQIDEEDEEELEVIYKTTLCDSDGLLNYEGLKQWDEIIKLFDDGLLGETEFNDIWDNTRKHPGTSNKFIDVDGFLSFNVALDGLFEEDDDEDDDEGGDVDELNVVDIMGSVDDTADDEDVSPSDIFKEIANDKTMLVGMNELKSWNELQEMLSDDDLSPNELQKIFDSTPKASGTTDMLDEPGFISLYDAIDELFEEVDDEAGNDERDVEKSPQQQQQQQQQQQMQQQQQVVSDVPNVKEDLLAVLSNLNKDEERLPCGLEGTDKEDERILNIVTELESDVRTNKIIQTQGNIQMSDLDGTWELLYSTSSAFRFNKGVSGLAGSFPNGKFGSLKQKLSATKYLTDMEYIEHIDVTPSTASFDVVINGDWQVNSDVSMFTGQPITVLRVVPDRVVYGPTSTRADHWKSVGPMNSLDLTYLDDDLRIMRGNTSMDTVFVFRRLSI